MNQWSSIEDEIKDASMGRPHVVILGSGASRAAFPNGDKFGEKLPLMNDLVEIINLEPVLKNHHIEWKDKNFEEVYSELSSEKRYQPLLMEIEENIYRYFSKLEIPDNPTIYDHLILSLRKKDLIATFNWDPLLMKAYVRNRNQNKIDLPYLVFLHGNVAIGYCKSDRIKGSNGNICPKCKRPFSRSKLLYPIKDKNYRNDHFISLEWRNLEKFLESAYVLTIFGYSAPKSDVAAIDLMKKAFEGNPVRNLVEPEIIDVKKEDELYETWRYFTDGIHYYIYCDFYDSSIAMYPRRTCEAQWQASMEANFSLPPNNIPKNYTFDELYKWIDPLKKAEEQATSKL